MEWTLPDHCATSFKGPEPHACVDPRSVLLRDGQEMDIGFILLVGCECLSSAVGYCMDEHQPASLDALVRIIEEARRHGPNRAWKALVSADTALSTGEPDIAPSR